MRSRLLTLIVLAAAAWGLWHWALAADGQQAPMTTEGLLFPHLDRASITSIHMTLDFGYDLELEREPAGPWRITAPTNERARAERLTELVSNLLQLARADDRPATSVVDLGELVRDRVDTWTASADERDVELGHRADDEAVPVRSIPGAIEQILDNLLDNAVAVSSPGSRVDVEIDRAAPGFVALRVVDHGPGLDDAAKVDAMRRFWRGDTSHPGTGLGLAIVDTLTTASGGRVTLADTVGGGLTVIVELPVGRCDPE